MARPTSNIPIVLFPLKLETRFIGEQLWIRALPDLPFLESHDPRLTEEELASAHHFKQALAETEDIDEQGQPDLYREKEEALKVAWEVLVAKYGIYRSAWIVQISPEALELQSNRPSENGAGGSDEVPTFLFRWLPDHLAFYLYKAGDSIDQPAYTVEGASIERKDVVGLPVLGEGDGWIEDFQQAVDVGMAVVVNLKREDLESDSLIFEKIVVCGFRMKEDAVESAEGLAELFHNHQYTEGFSFLEYGTPTNNTEKAKSGYSSKDEFDAPKSFHYAVQGLALEDGEENKLDAYIQPATAGKYLSQSLGFATRDLRHIQHADIRLPRFHGLVQMATWFALGPQPLFNLFGEQIDAEAHIGIWKHFAKYVKARGLHTALRIGNQPYGVLPVMNISKALTDRRISESKQLFDQMMILFALLMRRWLRMVKEERELIPRLGDENDTLEEILKILSMQEGSSTYQIRALQYHFFQKELYKFQKRSPAGSVTDLETAIPSQTSLRAAFDRVKQRIDSLVSLLRGEPDPDGKMDGIPVDEDRLLRSAVLSFAEGPAQVMEFEAGQSILTDPAGERLVGEEEGTAASPDDSFSFTENDLENLQDFIRTLRENSEGGLIFYRGKLSLFTDLLLRSYNNAVQLYSRKIVFDPNSADRTGYRYPRAATVHKGEGSSVKKGETVLEIMGTSITPGGAAKRISVSAPFDGTIGKIMIPQAGGEDAGPADELRVGMPLFTLVNQTTHREIKELFQELGQQIIEELNAVAELQDRTALQKSAIGEAIDLSSYRLDAWISSLAARRIEEMRSRDDRGIYFGAYGWVENLERDQEKPVREIDGKYFDENRRGEGGFIHTPGAAQAVASAVFKNAYLARMEDGNSPFTLNLTSDRLQKAKFLLEGLRQGQDLEALLGYQLERYLHEHPGGGLHEEIYALREAYPLYENVGSGNGPTTGFTKLSVIDGLKAIKNKNHLALNGTSDKAAVVAYIEKLEDTLDGSLDTLFYEAGYQVTQGNMSQAAAAMDATKGLIEPPTIESLKTNIPGTGISHKVAMILPRADVEYPIDHPRAFAEPALEQWLETHIGPWDKIGCVVELSDAEDGSAIGATTVSMEALNLAYQDLLYLSQDPVSDGASELELRIWQVASEQLDSVPQTAKYHITEAAPEDAQPLAKALEVARYAFTLLHQCRPLKSEDLSLEGDTVQYDREALNRIRDDRLLPLTQRLQSIVDEDPKRPEHLQFLAKLDIATAKTMLFDGEAVDADQLRSAIGKKMAAIDKLWAQYTDHLSFDAAFDLLEQIAKLLFGPAFVLLPPALPSDRFTAAVQEDRQVRLVGDPASNGTGQVWGQQRVKNWIQGVAQVQENTQAFEDWLMIDQVWQQLADLPGSYQWKVVQGPTLMQYPWLALSKDEIRSLLDEEYAAAEIYQDPKTGLSYPLHGEQYYPDGCNCTVLYQPAPTLWEEAGEKVPQFGLIIDEFSEHIPDEQVDTGLSFHYDAPNNEAPQAILLALHPKADLSRNYDWKEEELRDIVFDVIDLYKIRLVDIEAMQEYGYVLPMPYWLNIPTVK